MRWRSDVNLESAVMTKSGTRFLTVEGEASPNIQHEPREPCIM